MEKLYLGKRCFSLFLFLLWGMELFGDNGRFAFSVRLSARRTFLFSGGINIFQDPGPQLKTLAKILCALGSFVSLLSGICLLFQGLGGMVIGFFILTFGLSMSWILSFILYGIGKTIEQTERIAENTHRMAQYTLLSLSNAIHHSESTPTQPNTNASE